MANEMKANQGSVNNANGSFSYAMNDNSIGYIFWSTQTDSCILCKVKQYDRNKSKTGEFEISVNANTESIVALSLGDISEKKNLLNALAQDNPVFAKGNPKPA